MKKQIQAKAVDSKRLTVKDIRLIRRALEGYAELQQAIHNQSKDSQQERTKRQARTAREDMNRARLIARWKLQSLQPPTDEVELFVKIMQDRHGLKREAILKRIKQLDDALTNANRPIVIPAVAPNYSIETKQKVQPKERFIISLKAKNMASCYFDSNELIVYLSRPALGSLLRNLKEQNRIKDQAQEKKDQAAWMRAQERDTLKGSKRKG